MSHATRDKTLLFYITTTRLSLSMVQDSAASLLFLLPFLSPSFLPFACLLAGRLERKFKERLKEMLVFPLHPFF